MPFDDFRAILSCGECPPPRRAKPVGSGYRGGRLDVSVLTSLSLAAWSASRSIAGTTAISTDATAPTASSSASRAGTNPLGRVGRGRPAQHDARWEPVAVVDGLVLADVRKTDEGPQPERVHYDLPAVLSREAQEVVASPSIRSIRWYGGPARAWPCGERDRVGELEADERLGRTGLRRPRRPAATAS